MSTKSDSEIDMDGPGSFCRARNPTGTNSQTNSMTSLQKISLAITGSMEKFFYRWGFFVATHPLKAISCCLLITSICGLGIFNFTMENRPDKLWIPRNSEFAQNTEWIRATFPSPIRTSFAIVTADNVLVPEVMRVILNIHERVKQIEVTGGKNWESLCYKLPITKFLSKRKRRSIGQAYLHSNSTTNSHTGLQILSNDFDDAFDDEFFSENSTLKPQTSESGFSQLFVVPDEFYCSIVNELDAACWEVSPAELWSFDKSLIDNLTQEEIIRVVNHELISPIFGRSVNYTAEFGGNIVRNDLGEVISAGSVLLRWSIGINQTLLQEGRVVTDKTGEVADDDCLEWELKWIDLMKNISKDMPPGINTYFVNSQSWMEISEATILDDGMQLAMGFIIMFFYVGIMLGKFNVVEQRPLLTIAGLSCVGLACVVSYGLCSLCFIVYGPVNKILPFLLLGIGIDDMFVIMQCWNNLFSSPLTNKSKLSIPERMGMAMKHAGVSITVTSLTDVAAFGVGASTIMPGLQSFCIYAAVGIIAVFLLQATFFVACFALDQKRVEDRRNAFFLWIKYKEDEFIPNSWSQESYLQTLFNRILAKYLFTPWAKITVILITLSMLGVTMYGNTLLRQEFDPMWFLPSDSYMSKYVEKRETYYPGTGYPSFLVANQVNWSESFQSFDRVLNDLKSSDAIYNLENWYDDFKEYSNANFDTNIPNRPLTPSKFQKYMGKFLYSPAGSKHRPYFKSDGNFSCGESLPPLKTVVMPFRFRKFNGPQEHIPALRKVKSLLKTANMTFNHHESPKFFVTGTGLVAWETDNIINAELYRNVSLSLLCVLVTTFLLLANFRICAFCGICVVLTLINVGGFMHFWGLSIDTVSTIDIVLAIGLCVDYATHIALAFMTCTGSRESRAKQALKNIGPAVLNGGFSTFLAIILLAGSKSHAFQSFFKIFSVVIVCGLFHGLIFLPVLLSIFGPEPYPFAYSRDHELFDAFKPQKVVEMKPLQNSQVQVEVKDSSNANNPLFSTNNNLAPLLLCSREFESQVQRTQQ
ncbi:protein patched homolog 2 isoform X2 [Folsomia candida]|uniref:protein patched homolog 2 isoform X2 n=1 Tax=Folsomia candida TaxID=158441 RepID=UPI000B8F6BB2|nr:protein patched homolog 2 isoform X2 [Folsomia candida]